MHVMVESFEYLRLIFIDYNKNTKDFIKNYSVSYNYSRYPVFFFRFSPFNFPREATTGH